LWARQITETTAKIDNIPLSRGNDLGDLMEFDPQTYKVKCVLEKATWTAGVKYDKSGEPEEIRNRFRSIRTYLKEHDIHMEGAVAGVAMISLPRDISVEQLQPILQMCPESIELA